MLELGQLVALRFALNEVSAMVWEWRDRYEAYFVTPDTLESLWFAETEIGEAKDAFIRQLSGGRFNRNVQHKDLRVNHELVQCLMMVITALGRDADLICRRIEPGTISEIMHLISGASYLLECGHEWAWRAPAVNAAYALAAAIEDPIATMEQVLDDLYERRVKPKLGEVEPCRCS